MSIWDRYSEYMDVLFKHIPGDAKDVLVFYIRCTCSMWRSITVLFSWRAAARPQGHK